MNGRTEVPEEGRPEPPTIHMVGNAHLDPAWMWQWGEGMEAFLATCRSALDRMEENTEFVFTCSSAAHYRWVEEVEPELFERIAQRVAEGRWAIVGGWWTQADCNLPSGEGFVRQALLGQRYFMSRFGRIARVGYSPDAFGHCHGLPQLLGGAGMTGYIFCRPDPNELELPAPLFRWRGLDGSSVLGYRVPFHYNMYESSVPKKVEDLERIYQERLGPMGRSWCLFYGVGNHGGGPTKEHIAQIVEIDRNPDRPRLLFSDPERFLAEAAADESRVIPEWIDDLQLNAPGCYSAHSEIKKLNRESEHLLAQAERLASLAAILTGAPYPGRELREAWENVCFNHFHDILCGVAVREALEDAIGMYGTALSRARSVTRYSLARLARTVDTTGEGRTLIVFNSHAMPVREYVTFELWHDIDKALWSQPVHITVTDDAGNDLPCQLGFTSGKIGKDRIAVTFRADVPALGWNCYRVHYGRRSVHEDRRDVLVEDDGGEIVTMKNNHITIRISRATGAVVGLLHRSTGLEIVDGAAAVPIPIDDPTDTWGHGVTTFNKIAGRFGEGEARLVEHGPTHAVIRTRSRFRSSWVQQDFRLHADSPDVHVDLKLFWGERNTMLKLGFGTTISDADALYEGAYSVTAKPCDGAERPGGSWGALEGAIDGTSLTFAVVNDAKHGYSAETTPGGTSLRLTVLRSPPYALHDPHPFHEDEDLDYLDQGVQRFRYIMRVLEGEDRRASLAESAGLLSAPLVPHFESGHEGSGRSCNGIIVSSGTLSVRVLKRAEDEDGWIVRLFESEGIPAAGTVSIPALGVSWEVKLGPYEVASWRVTEGKITLTNLVELDL